ncbi:MAG: hypothetical protein DRP63_00770 [Planctomycetota bacterium]|nr:MAG: hypothetical protein DRP63_00770 [Planctomycetota bacterium]
MEKLEKLLAQMEIHLKEMTQLLFALRKELRNVERQTTVPSSAEPQVSAKSPTNETLIVVEENARQPEKANEELEGQVNRGQLLSPMVELAKRTPGLFGSKEMKELLRASQREWTEGDDETLEYVRVVWLCAAVRCRLALASSEPLQRLEKLLSSAESAFAKEYAILWRKQQVEKEYFQPVPVYADEREGTAIAVVEPAVKKNEQALKVGRVALSVGKNHKVSEVVIAAIKALSSVQPPNPEASREIYSFLRQFHSWWLGMPRTLKPEHEQARLRDVLNALDLLTWRYKMRSGAVTACVQNILSILKEMGFKEIYVPSGRKFDETLSPSKFEREFVRSNAPPGTIVGVIRRGFVDTSGTAVQKVLVAVSR